MTTYKLQQIKNYETAIEVLKKYNEWRRGGLNSPDDNLPPMPLPDPKGIGIAIDTVVKQFYQTKKT